LFSRLSRTFSKPSNLSSLFLDKYRRHSEEEETLGSPENSLKDEEKREEDSRVFQKKIATVNFLKRDQRRERDERRTRELKRI
jgi:hypothetical protein